ncbi:hypothetical protein D3C86_1878630 [compost metagenome]
MISNAKSSRNGADADPADLYGAFQEHHYFRIEAGIFTGCLLFAVVADRQISSSSINLTKLLLDYSGQRIYI